MRNAIVVAILVAIAVEVVLIAAATVDQEMFHSSLRRNIRCVGSVMVAANAGYAMEEAG